MDNSAPADFSHITTVIFDLDGTLLRHTWHINKLTETLFERFANDLCPLNYAQFIECYWSKTGDMWYMMVDGVIDGDVAAKYGYVNALRALGKDAVLAEAMVAYWQELVLNEIEPFEDAFIVLDALRPKYTTGILTNGFTTLQRAKIERHHWAAHVNFTLISEELGYHKPDRRVFLETLKIAGNPLPHQTLYVGDNPVNDIEGAQNAGLRPILMNPDNDLLPPPGVIKIRRLGELLVLLLD
ncbi:MAG: HAD family hydrolase [Anaerolineae bacterium]|nr:HAD family hydrolase [Anaerolineae bacterium]